MKTIFISLMLAVAVLAQDSPPPAPPAPPPLVVPTQTVPAATTGTAIPSFQVQTGGGTGPNTFAVANGSALPAGLTISAAGVISGTPTVAGTTSVTVQVTDSSTPPVTATSTISITVKSQWGPYDTPAAVLICQMDQSSATQDGKMAPSIDSASGQPRCFTVPLAVAESCVRFMLTQTNGLNTDGSIAYKYYSWWDYVLQNFLQAVVMPLVDKFPPPSVAQAQAAAAAAAAAVDAAKQAVMMPGK
jgi:hypothetical protein